MRLLASLFVVSLLALGCQSESSLGDLSKVAAAERDQAQSNWQRVERAFQANDQAALQNMVGQPVFILMDASGSPGTGKAVSDGERVATIKFGEVFAAGMRRENLTDKKVMERQRKAWDADRKKFDEQWGKAWRVDCEITFTEKQMRDHFAWPDAVFSANFELLGTLVEASLPGRSVRIKPFAIQLGILQL